MVENRAGGAEGAGETTGAEGAQAGEGTAGGTGAAGAAKRGGRQAAGAAGSAGAAGGGGATKTTRARRGAAAGAGGEEGGATSTRKRGGRAAAAKSGAAGTAKSGGAATARGGSRGRKAAAQQGPDLRQDLRDFATAHQQGWSHHDWLNLVNALEQRGHDVSDRDRLGRELERERLAMRLEQVQGMGERRVQALADHFGTLWSLRQASVDEIAGVPNINRQLAEKIQDQLR